MSKLDQVTQLALLVVILQGWACTPPTNGTEQASLASLSAPGRATIPQFVEKYGPTARQFGKKHKLPPSVLLAEAYSGSGAQLAPKGFDLFHQGKEFKSGWSAFKSYSGLVASKCADWDCDGDAECFVSTAVDRGLVNGADADKLRRLIGRFEAALNTQP